VARSTPPSVRSPIKQKTKNNKQFTAISPFEREKRFSIPHFSFVPMNIKELVIGYWILDDCVDVQIPYGVAGRLESAREADKWEGTLDATGVEQGCSGILINFNLHVGVEDCLKVHVFTPDVSTEFPHSIAIYLNPTSNSNSTPVPDEMECHFEIRTSPISWVLGPWWI
jgi:Carboxylesterase family